MIDVDGVDWAEVGRDYIAWELTVQELRDKHLLSPVELYGFLSAHPEIPRRGKGRRGGELRSGRRVGAWDGRVKFLPDRSLDRAVFWYQNCDLPVRRLAKVMGVTPGRLIWEVKVRGLPLRTRQPL